MDLHSENKLSWNVRHKVNIWAFKETCSRFDDPLMFSSFEADVLLGLAVNGILTPITRETLALDSAPLKDKET